MLSSYFEEVLFPISSKVFLWNSMGLKLPSIITLSLLTPPPPPICLLNHLNVWTLWRHSLLHVHPNKTFLKTYFSNSSCFDGCTCDTILLTWLGLSSTEKYSSHIASHEVKNW